MRPKEARQQQLEVAVKPKDAFPLHLMKVVVIGAGPAGLHAAQLASRLGASVQVLEKAGDPRGHDPGYTNRSFNFTLIQEGRDSLGNSQAWSGGVPVFGRAIHKFNGSSETHYTSYGDEPDANLTSISRPRFRQNLSTIAEEAGVSLEFGSQVTNLDPETGKVTYETSHGMNELTTADVIIVADGLHSVADPIIASMSDGKVQKTIDALGYVTGMITETEHNLSPNYLHFWHEPGLDSYVIGVPNLDGSIAVLFISPFSDTTADTQPFPNSTVARKRLQADFPQLLDIDPTLPETLPGKYRGNFHYKSVSHFALGARGVLVGDAGMAAPPWAGYGANTALHTATKLIQSIRDAEGSVKDGFLEYEAYYRALTTLLCNHILDHGKFLKEGVTQHPGARSERVFHKILSQAEVLKASFL